MVLLLDSETVPPRGRIEAINAAIADTEVPMTFFDNSGGDPRLRLHHSATGTGSHVALAVGTGSRFRRTARQLELPGPARVSIALQLGSQAVLTAGGADTVTAPGHLLLADETRTFDYRWAGLGGTKAFVVDYEQLGLPVDMVRAAASRLRQSPLYSLFRTHLSGLCEHDDELPPGPARAMLGAATTELLRALIAAAAGHDVRQHGLLYLRITTYVGQHLREVTLSPVRIAAAHSISVRQLYKIWSGSTDTPLSEWVMAARLEGARRELGQAAAGPVTIATVARRWGFPDSTHFSKRFRCAYGLSPGEWRRINTAPALESPSVGGAF
jgi:AraC-like DNA-binding protein